MNLKRLIFFIFLLGANFASADSARAPEFVPGAAFGLCAPYLSVHPRSLDPRERLLQNLAAPGLQATSAIRAIVAYLAPLEAAGFEKVRAWRDFIGAYNLAHRGSGIISICLETPDADFACRGAARGPLLVFRRDGAVFSGNNPLRPHLQNGERVDYDDPTLVRR